MRTEVPPEASGLLNLANPIELKYAYNEKDLCKTDSKENNRDKTGSKENSRDKVGCEENIKGKRKTEDSLLD